MEKFILQSLFAGASGDVYPYLVPDFLTGLTPLENKPGHGGTAIKLSFYDIIQGWYASPVLYFLTGLTLSFDKRIVSP